MPGVALRRIHPEVGARESLFLQYRAVQYRYPARTAWTIYVQAIRDSGIAFDMLFGPAYKGVPLACAAAMAFVEHGRDIPYAFNRKGGEKIRRGWRYRRPSAQGKVLIIDECNHRRDVRARIGSRSSMPAAPCPRAWPPPLIARNAGEGAASAVPEAEKTLGLRVVSIANLDNLAHLPARARATSAKHVQAIDAYRRKYGFLAKQ